MQKNYSIFRKGDILAYYDRILAVMEIILKRRSLQVNNCYRHRCTLQNHMHRRAQQRDNTPPFGIGASDSHASHYFNIIFAQIAATKADIKSLEALIRTYLNEELYGKKPTSIPRSFYGAANTNNVFTGNDRGLTSIVLELELVYP